MNNKSEIQKNFILYSLRNEVYSVYKCTTSGYTVGPTKSTPRGREERRSSIRILVTRPFKLTGNSENIHLNHDFYRQYFH